SGWSTRANAPYVDILINACKGGGGGTYGADGYDHIGLITSGGAIAAQDPEIFELVNPHFLHRFEYLPASASRPCSRSRTAASRRASSATPARPRRRRSAFSAGAAAPRTRWSSATPTARATGRT